MCFLYPNFISFSLISDAILILFSHRIYSSSCLTTLKTDTVNIFVILYVSASVTRFGDFSPLWLNFKNLADLFEGFDNILSQSGEISPNMVTLFTNFHLGKGKRFIVSAIENCNCVVLFVPSCHLFQLDHHHHSDVVKNFKFSENRLFSETFIRMLQIFSANDRIHGDHQCDQIWQNFATYANF